MIITQTNDNYIFVYNSKPYKIHEAISLVGFVRYDWLSLEGHSTDCILYTLDGIIKTQWEEGCETIRPYREVGK